MQNLTKAHQELFRRAPDACFPSLDRLYEHCYSQSQSSKDRWHPPQSIRPVVVDNPAGHSGLDLEIAGTGRFVMNDWSFSQLCALARVSKETVKTT